MPYLNWKTRPLGLSLKEMDPHSCARLGLELDADELSLLIPQLEEIFHRGGAELRMDLPENWIVFWKSRESETRLLLAHPQEGEWVATAALEIETGKKLVEDLKVIQAGNQLRLQDPSYVNNVVIEITHRHASSK